MEDIPFEEQPPPQQQMPFQYLPPQNEFMAENSLRYQLSSEDIIDEIKHTLLGFKKVFNQTNQTEEWVKDKDNPGVINEQGMRYIEVFLRGRLNKLYKLTSLDEEAISFITIQCGTNLWDSMVINFDKWGIIDPAAIKMIVDYITDTIYVTLCAAKDGEYLLFLRTTQRFVESQVLNNQPRVQQQPQGGRSGLSKIPLLGGFFK